MNDLQTVSNQTPIEIALQIDENGMTTARKLYEFLGLNKAVFARWAKQNIENNEYFEQNKDWWGFNIMLNGNECKDYRLTTEFAKHLSMESHSEKGKVARQYFITVENKVKQEVINYQQLSPELQIMQNMLNKMAITEIEQKRQAEQLNKVETTVENMKEEFVRPIGDWRSEINAKVREISIKSGIAYQQLFGEMYGELEQKARCNLKRLCENKKARLENAGQTKTYIKNETTKIAIIESKPQLKDIFENIVRRYAMRYCV